MSKARAGSKAPGVGRTFDLAAEAASMEMKLMELKRAMEKERTKRENISATATPSGALWKNGENGLLRGKFRTAQAAAGLKPPDNSSQHYGSRMPAAGGPQAGQHAYKSPRNGFDSQSPPTPPPPPEEKPSVSGSGIVAPSQRSGSAASQQRAGVAPVRKADIFAVVHRDHEEVEGMGCGMEAGEDLTEGGFNEGDSHKSFLDALAAWRNGNKPAGEAAEASSSQAKQQASSSTSARPPAHAPGVVMEVQTEAAAPHAAAGRPGSALRPISFFDKLVINENSRQAGQAASGGEPSTSSRPFSASSPKPGGAASAAADGAERGDADEHSRAEAEAEEEYGTAGGTAAVAGAPEPGSTTAKLAILERLEALERQQQAAAAAPGGAGEEEEEEEGGVAVLTAVTGRGMTKGTRLPDNIVVPDGERE